MIRAAGDAELPHLVNAWLEIDAAWGRSIEREDDGDPALRAQLAALERAILSHCCGDMRAQLAQLAFMARIAAEMLDADEAAENEAAAQRALAMLAA